MNRRLMKVIASPKARRPFWRNVHLWLGLTLGLPIALFGLTGSVLVFWHEIDAALNPDFYHVPRVPADGRKAFQASFAAAEAVAPANWESSGIEVQPEKDAALAFHFYYPPDQAIQAGAESFNVFVDPYTGRVLGTRIFYHPWNPLKHCFIGFFFKLHYALLLKETGFLIVGIMALMLVISILAGMILWWPLDGKWRRALSVKRGAGPVRLNHDLHQVFGVYTVIVSLAVLVSGVSFNLADEFKWLVGSFSSLTPEATASGIRSDAVVQISVDQIIASLDSKQSGGELNYLSQTSPGARTLTACYRNVPALSAYIVDNSCYTVDRATGEILQIRDPSRGTAGDVFMQWQWPLHSGQAFGWTGRILVFLCGLACPVLFFTGTIRWLQKRRSRARQAARLAAQHT